MGCLGSYYLVWISGSSLDRRSQSLVARLQADLRRPLNRMLIKLVVKASCSSLESYWLNLFESPQEFD